MTTNSIEGLSARDLRRAATIKEKIEKLGAELSKLLGSSRPTAAPTAGGKKKRRMSAKARALISAAQKARWAKLKAPKK